MTKPNFIPPPKPKQDIYATEIPSRRPKFKIHSNIGHAKNAIKFHSGTTYYRKIEQPPPDVSGLYYRMFKKVGDDWEYIPELSVDPGVTHELIATPSSWDNYVHWKWALINND